MMYQNRTASAKMHADDALAHESGGKKTWQDK